MAFHDGAWQPLGTKAAVFGVNTAADMTNRLSVKSDAELLSHDDVTPGKGDARKVINKAASGNAASVVFQTGFSGRAEFGLVGDDRFRLKVSADGAAFADALVIDPASGDAGFGAGTAGATLAVAMGDMQGGSSFRGYTPGRGVRPDRSGACRGR
ncbi:hypothetical protein [Hyphomonas sp.]|uniref:hypothetical protein n=1 Tax=Hyphomonas sp. TaxID=87 RepID=UPI003F6F8644